MLDPGKPFFSSLFIIHIGALNLPESRVVLLSNIRLGLLGSYSLPFLLLIYPWPKLYLQVRLKLITCVPSKCLS